ncbi:uncharacterized protein EDB91DRAFT_1294058 [Suillus paluster]|uniref:uncharacterized protein n=1 Tax=Suillus paluster TaxID=48578 RepID=UPI001B8872B0|nr:uncharacterized protein EDB91DRAFT_1294058 [Suillus paluster]KAG1736071.1 hypothetical protein EDB91DRAFT_1294058 [Suillus paluster]
MDKGEGERWLAVSAYALLEIWGASYAIRLQAISGFKALLVSCNSHRLPETALRTEEARKTPKRHARSSAGIQATGQISNHSYGTMPITIMTDLNVGRRSICQEIDCMSEKERSVDGESRAVAPVFQTLKLGHVPCQISVTTRKMMWPRVTALKLVAEDNFIMDLPLTIPKAMISCQWEAAGQEVLGKVEEELNSMGFEGVHPIMALHVHGVQPLPPEERFGSRHM